MNILLGALGANLTLGVIATVTSTIKTANGVFTLSKNIVNSTTSGANEVRQIIKDLDLEFKIKTTQYFLCELKISKDSPYTILYCIQAIRDAINDIAEELEKIHYRLQYNDNVWFGTTIRAYKFDNCKGRIQASLNNLDKRRQTLLELMGMENNMMVRNPILEDDMADVILQLEDIDPQAATNVRREIVKKLDYINR